MKIMAEHHDTTNRKQWEWLGIDGAPEPMATGKKREPRNRFGHRDYTRRIPGRWVVALWSRRDLSNILTQATRIMIFAAASFAALRLEQLAGPDATRIGSRAHLTPRELSVLRLVSAGKQCHAAAQALGLGDETIRSHLKKAQAKLGVRNRAHAVAEALRQNLIP